MKDKKKDRLIKNIKREIVRLIEKNFKSDNKYK